MQSPDGWLQASIFCHPDVRAWQARDDYVVLLAANACHPSDRYARYCMYKKLAYRSLTHAPRACS